MLLLACLGKFADVVGQGIWAAWPLFDIGSSVGRRKRGFVSESTGSVLYHHVSLTPSAPPAIPSRRTLSPPFS